MKGSKTKFKFKPSNRSKNVATARNVAKKMAGQGRSGSWSVKGTRSGVRVKDRSGRMMSQKDVARTAQMTSLMAGVTSGVSPISSGLGSMLKSMGTAKETAATAHAQAINGGAYQTGTGRDDDDDLDSGNVTAGSGSEGV